MMFFFNYFKLCEHYIHGRLPFRGLNRLKDNRLKRNLYSI